MPLKKKRIIILGAGISGMALAWHLQKKHDDAIQLTVLEKASRAGGWIQSIENDHFHFELGPHSCRPRGTGVATLQLIEDLHLEKEVIFADPAAAKRFLYFNKKLQQVPQNPFAVLTSPVTKGVFKAGLKDLFTSPSNKSDETIYDFFARRFGAAIAERLIDPLCTGIYAGDIRQLSVRSCFPLLHEWEQRHGSVIKGLFSKNKTLDKDISSFIKEMQKSSLFSFRSGMDTLTNSLGKHCEPFLHLSSEVKSLRLDSLPNQIEVLTANGKAFQADHVISALPSQAFSRLVEPLKPSLGRLLSSIAHASLVVVNVGFRKSVLKKQGFGYLVPSQEKEDVLGVIWDSCVFPEQNHSAEETRLTLMMGGAHHPFLVDLSDSAILEKVAEALSNHLGVRETPDAIHIQRIYNAIPQYALGHHQTVSAIEGEMLELSSRISCLGSSLYGVSINDCIANAKKKAEDFILTQG